MTIIFSNMLDPDCQSIMNMWYGLTNVNIIEITPNMDIDEAEDLVNNAIIAEDETIIFAGHGTKYGLLFPYFDKGYYIFHDQNINLVHAKNIFCAWCYASTFVDNYKYILHNCVATSMFISNVNEAHDSDIFNYTQEQINSNGQRFYSNVNQLLRDNIPLNEWIMQLGAKMDIENEIDTFNRQGLYYQE